MPVAHAKLLPATTQRNRRVGQHRMNDISSDGQPRVGQRWLPALRARAGTRGARRSRSADAERYAAGATTPARLLSGGYTSILYTTATGTNDCREHALFVKTCVFPLERNRRKASRLPRLLSPCVSARPVDCVLAQVVLAPTVELIRTHPPATMYCQ